MSKSIRYQLTHESHAVDAQDTGIRVRVRVVKSTPGNDIAQQQDTWLQEILQSAQSGILSPRHISRVDPVVSLLF